jgi:hypothetical protein
MSGRSALALREAFAAHPCARRLRMSFEPEPLAEALRSIREDWWKPHRGPYHDGGWECVALWAPGGNLFEQRSFGGAFAKTVAALVSPFFWQVVERFACEKNRVRLLRLKAGAHIFRHSDPLHDIDAGLVRVHIPVTTSPEVEFLVNDRRVLMRPGEVWHVDVRFPHEVHNRGASHRVHLVLDLVRNAAIDGLLDEAEPAGSGRLLGYYLKHSLPKPVKEYFSIGN